MGCALAKAAMLRGAEVTLVCAHMDIEPPMFVRTVNVTSAEDMFKAVTSLSDEQDIIIKAAAVSDYTPAVVFDSKVKKSGSDMKIELKRTKDILKYLGEHKRPGQILCGFSMETENVVENSAKKLESKCCDMICANSLSTKGAGFGADTNIITVITKDGCEELDIMSKEEAAHKIIDRLITLERK